MKIAIANDHAAVSEKNAVAKTLEELGHQVLNFGTDTLDSTDYPDYAAKVGEAVNQGHADLGILLCGTGIGMSIAANKIKGIRAALCHSEETAEKSREHNDANVLCCGARVLDLSVIQAIVKKFISTEFSGGRHQRRVQKMMAFEANL